MTLSSELFDAAVRDLLTAFFRKALHRDADRRYPASGAMRQAWQRIFTALDAERPAAGPGAA